eukprot:3265928-Pyramimonas_sp.AAC.2
MTVKVLLLLRTLATTFPIWYSFAWISYPPRYAYRVCSFKVIPLLDVSAGSQINDALGVWARSFDLGLWRRDTGSRTVGSRGISFHKPVGSVATVQTGRNSLHFFRSALVPLVAVGGNVVACKRCDARCARHYNA